jgi:hypothetical protein
MTRLTLTVITWLSLAPLVSASLTTRKPNPPLDEAARPTAIVDLSMKSPSTGTSPQNPRAFAVTDKTEVLLDGKPCLYASVPANATIVRIEVAADKKTAIKIQFRTQK